MGFLTSFKRVVGAAPKKKTWKKKAKKRTPPRKANGEFRRRKK
jgi:hypothetical protein